MAKYLRSDWWNGYYTVAHDGFIQAEYYEETSPGVWTVQIDSAWEFVQDLRLEGAECIKR